MNRLYEAWHVGMDMYYCYTENAEVRRELIRFNPRCATYEKSGRVFGWQHQVRKSALVYLDSKFGGKRTLKYNDLQTPKSQISPLEPIFTSADTY